MVEERLRVLKEKQFGASLLFFFSEYALLATVVVVYYQHRKQSADNNNNNNNSTDAADATSSSAQAPDSDTNNNGGGGGGGGNTLPPVAATAFDYTIVIVVLVALAVALVAVIMYMRTRKELEHTLAVLRKAKSDIETNEMAMEILRDDRAELQNKLRAEFENKANLEMQLEERSKNLREQLEDILEKKRKIVERLEKKRKVELQQKLMDAGGQTEEVNAVKKRVVKLSEQIIDKNAEIRELQTELEKNEMFNKQLQMAYDEKVAEIARNNKFEETRNEEIAKMRETIKNLKLIEDHYNKNIDTTREADRRVDAAQAIVRELTKKGEELLKKKNEEVNAIEVVLREAQKSLTVLKDIEKEKDQRISDLTRELQALKTTDTAENMKLQNNIHALTTEKEFLARYIENLDTRYTQLLDQNEGLQKENEERKLLEKSQAPPPLTRTASTETDNEDFSLYKTKYLETVDLLRKEQEARKKLIKETDDFSIETMQILSREMELAEEERNRFKKEIEFLQEVNDASTAQIEKLKNEKEAGIEKVKTDSMTKLEKTTQKVAELQTNLKQFEANLDQKRKQVEDSEKKNRDLIMDLDKKEGELLAVENKLEIMTLEMIEGKAKDAQQYRELISLYEAREKELEATSFNFDAATKRVEILEKQISDSENQYTKQKQFLSRMKKKFKMETDALKQKSLEEVQAILYERDAAMKLLQDAQRLASVNEETLKNQVVDLKNRLEWTGLRNEETIKRLKLMRVKKARELRKAKQLSERAKRKEDLSKKRLEKLKQKLRVLLDKRQKQARSTAEQQTEMSARIKALTEQVEDAQKKEETATKQLQEREVEVRRLVDEFDRQNDETTRSNEAFRNLNSELNNELQRVKDELKGWKKRSEKQIDEVAEELNRLSFHREHMEWKFDTDPESKEFTGGRKRLRK